LVSVTLNDTRVLFDGNPAPLIAVQAGQVSAVVPYSVSGERNTQVQVEYKGRRSNPVLLRVAETEASLFSADSSGMGQGAILNEDGTPNSSSNPATRGSIISLYGTGEGQTDPPGEDGRVAGKVLPKPRAPVSVRIDGSAADVLYSGAAPGLVAGI